MFSPKPLLCPQWVESRQASEHPTGAGRGGIKCPEFLLQQAWSLTSSIAGTFCSRAF